MNIVQQKIQTFRITDRIIDLILLFVSARLAIIAERVLHSKSWHALDPQSFHFSALLIIFTIWIILIHLLESDLIYRRTPIWNIIKTTAIISFIGVTTTITLDFLLKTDLFKRSTIGFFGLISFLLLLLKRGGMKYFLSSIREEGFDPKNILIIGSHKRAERIIHEFGEHREYGLRIRSILDPDTSRIGQAVDGMVVTGDMSNFRETLKDLEIDEVFFAIDLTMIEDIHNIFNYLDNIGVNYHMMINESVHTYSDKNLNIQPISSNYYGMPMLSFHSVTASHFKLYIKNGIEKAFAVLLIIFSFPILLLFGLLVYFTSKGPIFFKQERVGLHGRKFYQYKLRSMIVDAEELKEKYTHLNEQSGPVFKIKNDPRLTKIGKIMRKYSIDELPQLFNILLGSMTLIGPRPLPVSEVKEFNEDFLHRRHSMKPGVTGLWQVTGRNNIKDFNKWVKLDLEYIDNWSFMMDFRIAVKTVSTVLSGTGM
ncbi:MAG: sugar transferase [Candidatus Marinimicrobia bacterium]|nr:sugar transferase [Candidatus Neomarinimicrobiota bacterium]